MGQSKTYAAIAATLLVTALPARATEPDAKALTCLTSALQSASNAVSVTPAEDIFADAHNVLKPMRIVKKGVDFTYRKADGDVQTIGVYLSTEFDVRGIPGGDAFSTYAVVSNNGRFSLSLRDPYPKEWYPPAKDIHDSPSSWRSVRQDSPLHPLYGLWERLNSECRIDNLVNISNWTP